MHPAVILIIQYQVMPLLVQSEHPKSAFVPGISSNSQWDLKSLLVSGTPCMSTKKLNSTIRKEIVSVHMEGMDSVAHCRVDFWVLSGQIKYKWSQLLPYWEPASCCHNIQSFSAPGNWPQPPVYWSSPEFQ